MSKEYDSLQEHFDNWLATKKPMDDAFAQHLSALLSGLRSSEITESEFYLKLTSIKHEAEVYINPTVGPLAGFMKLVLCRDEQGNLIIRHHGGMSGKLVLNADSKLAIGRLSGSAFDVMPDGEVIKLGTLDMLIEQPEITQASLLDALLNCETYQQERSPLNLYLTPELRDIGSKEL